MAMRGKKAGKRATTRKRAAPARKPKSARTGSAGPKRKGAPAAALARLKDQLRAARDRQNATADILKVIASSPSDVQPVFKAIAESARRLLGSHSAVVTRVMDGVVHLAAGTAENEAATHAVQGLLPYPLSSPRIHARVARTGEIAFNVDAETSDLPRSVKEFARTVGWRSMLVVPMLRNGIAIGTIGITRREPGAFEEDTIDLLKTFADQAVIAIENARLFNETKEALERQTATADILKVIASSPSDVQPVFDAIAERSNRIVEGFSTTVLSIVDEIVHLSAFTRTSPTGDAALKAFFPRPLSTVSWSEAIARGEIFQIADSEVDLPAQSPSREMARLRGWRSSLYVPLLRDQKLIGAIGVTRVEAGAFADHHVQLLRTFADQAVIAIENVRLFTETKEALERQTATAEILKVIASSPSDVQPVFEAIAEQSNHLLNGLSTAVYSLTDDVLNLMAYTRVNPVADASLVALFPRPLSSLVFSEAIRSGEVCFASDSEVDYAAHPAILETVRLRGWRSALYVPLVRDGKTIGMISVTRVEPGEFAPHHVELLKTFADQAVIAIENARLFNEVQARTRDLTESLEQQTATSEVLEVISSSAGELAPVFDKMLENATRICGANFGTMSLYDGDRFQNVALYNLPPLYAASPASHTFRPHPESALATVARTKQVVQLEDIRTHKPYLEGDPAVVALTDLAGARTLAAVPMLKEKQLVGTIAIFRQEVRPFTDKQITLVSNFASQAVIAIENTRLLRELRERTDDLSTSLDELRTAQDRLIQTEKLASLGQLTAGIAHEIKNPLNFVNNFSAVSAELTDELNDILKSAGLTGKMRQEVDELTGLLKDNLEKVVQHGKRADSIVKNMLLHSRQGSGEQRLADINALVDESLNLAYHGARAEKSDFNITLQRDFDASAGHAELFPQEIARALLNLISNGFYAATKRKIDDAAHDFEPTLLAATKNLGGSVEIRIRDNGAGIPAEVREKMFNPFFTTKPAGEGTGLGLSMTHDIIVKQHGGSIDVATEPGQFSEFTIVLPRTSRSPNGTAGRT